MAMPTYVGNGSMVAATSGSVSPAWPAGHAVGDMGFLVVHRGPRGDSGIPTTLTAPSGWTDTQDGNISTGGVDDCRFQVFQRIATSTSESNVTVTMNTGDSLIMAAICALRGTDAVHLSANNSPPPQGSGVSFLPVTTTVPDCLILLLGTIGSVNATLNTVTSAGMTNIIKRLDSGTALGPSGKVIIHTAEKVTAGFTDQAAGTWVAAIGFTSTLTLAFGEGEPLPEEYSLPTPEQTGYTNDLDRNFIQIPLEGGHSRMRQDVYLPSHTVNCTWFLSATEYTEFMGYFRTTLQNASQPFLIDLITDIGELTTCKCRTLGGMPKLTQQKGGGYWVAAALEVENNPTYTGTITYQEPGDIIFATTFPYLVGPIVTGDTVRIMNSKGIHPTGSTPLNLDGIYTVSGTTGFNVLSLTSPASVNSDWTVLAGLGAPGVYGNAGNGNVISTVVKVPTL